MYTRFIRVLIAVCAVGTLAGSVSACGGESPAPSVTATTVPGLSPEQRQAAFDYYMSDERHAQLREVVTRLGNGWRDMMLDKAIPWKPYGQTMSYTAPANGDGVMASNPTNNPVFVLVKVRFDRGNVITTEGVHGIQIILNNTQASLDGDTVSGDATRTPLDMPGAFGWTLSTLGSNAMSMKIILASETLDKDSPNLSLPLDPTQKYKIVLSTPDGKNAEATVDDIKQADAQLIMFLNSHPVTGSDWK